MVGVATNRRNVGRLQPSLGSSAPRPDPYFPGFHVAPEGYESPTDKNKFFVRDFKMALFGTFALPFRAPKTRQNRRERCRASMVRGASLDEQTKDSSNPAGPYR